MCIYSSLTLSLISLVFAPPLPASAHAPRAQPTRDQIGCERHSLQARNGRWVDRNRRGQACDVVFIRGQAWRDIDHALRFARRLRRVDPSIEFVWALGRGNSAFIDRASFDAAVQSGTVPQGLVPAHFDFEKYMLVEYRETQPAPTLCNDQPPLVREKRRNARARIQNQWKYDANPETRSVGELVLVHSGEIEAPETTNCSSRWVHRTVLGRVEKTDRVVRVMLR